MTYNLSPCHKMPGTFSSPFPVDHLFPLAKHALSLRLTNPTAARFFSNHRLSTRSSLFALSLSDLVSFTLLSLAIITHAHAFWAPEAQRHLKINTPVSWKGQYAKPPPNAQGADRPKDADKPLVGFEVQQGSYLQERSPGWQQDKADPCTVHPQTICLMPL